MGSSRMKRLVRALLGAILLTAVASCDRYGAHAMVIRANYNVSRGDYQNAIVDYLRAAEVMEYEPWLSYNLGNVYHSLGESQAALEMWDLAQTVEVNDLLFGAAFNRGVYYFEQGDFERASAQFRFALRIDGADLAAKRNLELSLEKLRAEGDLTAGGAESEQRVQASGSGGRIIDYIRRKEEQRWRSNATRAPEPGVRDW